MAKGSKNCEPMDVGLLGSVFILSNSFVHELPSVKTTNEERRYFLLLENISGSGFSGSKGVTGLGPGFSGFED
jgi:hypothetical protein